LLSPRPDVGGVAKRFTLKEKGRSPRSKTELFKVRVRRKKGVAIAADGMFIAKLRKASYADFFTDEGLMGDADVKPAEARQINVTEYFNSAIYQTTVNVMYKAKTGKKGVAKGP
jgi:hypothetical protein